MVRHDGKSLISAVGNNRLSEFVNMRRTSSVSSQFSSSSNFTLQLFRPICGPCRGGTKLTLFGTDFRYGDIRIRFVSGSNPNKIMYTLSGEWVTASEIVCENLPYQPTDSTSDNDTDSNVNKAAKVMVSINGSNFKSFQDDFHFYNEPLVESIFPSALPMINDQEKEIFILVEPEVLHLDSTEAVNKCWKNFMKKMQISVKVSFKNPTRRRGSEFKYNEKSGSSMCGDLVIDGKCEDVTEIIAEKSFKKISQACKDSSMQKSLVIKFHLPKTLNQGFYHFSISLNGQQFNQVRNIEHLVIFPIPSTEEISPSACFFKGGQEIALRGNSFHSYTTHSDKQRVLIKIYSNTTDCTQSKLVNFVHDRMDEMILISGKVINNSYISFIAPRFQTIGSYHLSLSINDGVDYFESKSMLMVYLEPVCKSLSPVFGHSRGGTTIQMSIMFLQPRLCQGEALIPMQESNFMDTGSIAVRFLFLTTANVLNTVAARVSKDKKYIEFETPENSDVESFRYSLQEAVALQLTLDGLLFFNMQPEKPFSFYASPKIKYISCKYGPSSGDTQTTIFVEHFIPDTRHILIRFQSRLTGQAQDVEGRKDSTGLGIECLTPSWEFDPESRSHSVDILTTFNGIDFSNNGEQELAVFTYYHNPVISFLYPRYGVNIGGVPISVHGENIEDVGGKIKVAFSNGKMTYFAEGTCSNERILCKTPKFIPGKCQVCISLNGQQFTGVWNKHGDCISDDPNSEFVFYEKPYCFDIKPSCGPIRGGTEVVIFGKGFLETKIIEVRFTSVNGYFEVTIPAYLKGDELHCIAPVVPKKGQVLISCSFNSRDFTNDKVYFQYYDKLHLSTISPSKGTKGFPMDVDLELSGLIASKFVLGRLVFDVGCNNIVRGDSVRGIIKSKSVAHFCFIPPSLVSNQLAILIDYVVAIHFRRIFIEVALDGQQFLNLGNIFNDTFQYRLFNKPSIKKIHPACGPSSGGTLIRFLGDCFQDTGHIIFRFSIKSSNRLEQLLVKGSFVDSGCITCISPPIPNSHNSTSLICANIELSITPNTFFNIQPQHSNPFKRIRIREKDANYLYYAPVVFNKMAFNLGPITGGTIVHLYGEKIYPFAEGYLTAKFGQIPVSCTYVSENEMTCISPGLPCGFYDVTISLNSNDYSEVEGGACKVPKERYTAYKSPIFFKGEFEGPSCGGTVFNIHGKHFPKMNYLKVLFLMEESGSQIITMATPKSNNCIECISPKSSILGTFKLHIALNGQNFYETRILFEYFEAISFKKVHPICCPVETGADVTLSLKSSLCLPKIRNEGYYLEKCIIKLMPYCPTTIVSEKSSETYIPIAAIFLNEPTIQATFPLDLLPGRYWIFVSFDDGIQFTNSNHLFTYFRQPKNILKIFPPCGLMTGDTKIRVYTDFSDDKFPACTVYLKFTQVFTSTVSLCYDVEGNIDHSIIFCSTPSILQGMLDSKVHPLELSKSMLFSIEVSLDGNNYFGSINHEIMFTYYPTPILLDISPKYIPIGENTKVSISGQYLEDYQGAIEIELSAPLERICIPAKLGSNNDIVACVTSEISTSLCKSLVNNTKKLNVQVTLNGQQFTGVSNDQSIFEVLMYKVPVYLEPSNIIQQAGQEIKLYGGKEIAPFINLPLSSRRTSLVKAIRIRVQCTEKEGFFPEHFAIPTLLTANPPSLSFKTPSLNEVGKYKVDLIVGYGADNLTMRNGLNLVVHKCPTLKSIFPQCSFFSEDPLRLTIRGNYFYRSSHIRAKVTLSFVVGYTKTKMTEYTCVVDSSKENEYSISVGSTNEFLKTMDVESNQIVCAKVYLSYDNGARFVNNSVRFWILHSEFLDRLLLLSTNYAWDPCSKQLLSPIKIQIDVKIFKVFSLLDSKYFAVRLANNGRKTYKISCLLRSDHLLVIPTQVDCIGNYNVDFTPNGLDYFNVGDVVLHNAVEFHQISKHNIAYLFSHEIIVQYTRSSILQLCTPEQCRISYFFVHSPDIIYSIDKICFNATEFSFTLPSINRVGKIGFFLEAETLKAILSSTAYLDLFNHMDWKVTKIEPNTISLNQNAPLKIYGDHFCDTNDISIRFSGDNLNEVVQGYVGIIDQLQIVVHEASNVISPQNSCKGLLVQITYEGKSYCTSFAGVDLSWDSTFVVDVENRESSVRIDIMDKTASNMKFSIAYTLIKVNEIQNCDFQWFTLEDNFVQSRTPGQILLSLQWKEIKKDLGFVTCIAPKIDTEQDISIAISPSNNFFIPSGLSVRYAFLDLSFEVRPSLIPWELGGNIMILGGPWKKSNSIIARVFELPRNGRNRLFVMDLDVNYISETELNTVIPAYFQSQTRQLTLFISFDKVNFFPSDESPVLNLYHLEAITPSCGPTIGNTEIQLEVRGNISDSSDIQVIFIWRSLDQILHRCCISGTISSMNDKFQTIVKATTSACPKLPFQTNNVQVEVLFIPRQKYNKSNNSCSDDPQQNSSINFLQSSKMPFRYIQNPCIQKLSATKNSVPGISKITCEGKYFTAMDTHLRFRPIFLDSAIRGIEIIGSLNPAASSSTSICCILPRLPIVGTQPVFIDTESQHSLNLPSILWHRNYGTHICVTQGRNIEMKRKNQKSNALIELHVAYGNRVFKTIVQEIWHEKRKWRRNFIWNTSFFFNIDLLLNCKQEGECLGFFLYDMALDERHRLLGYKELPHIDFKQQMDYGKVSKFWIKLDSKSSMVEDEAEGEIEVAFMCFHSKNCLEGLPMRDLKYSHPSAYYVEASVNGIDFDDFDRKFTIDIFQQPIISKIVPSCGSWEGGTQLQVYLENITDLRDSKDLKPFILFYTLTKNEDKVSWYEIVPAKRTRIGFQCTTPTLCQPKQVDIIQNIFFSVSVNGKDYSDFQLYDKFRVFQAYNIPAIKDIKLVDNFYTNSLHFLISHLPITSELEILVRFQSISGDNKDRMTYTEKAKVVSNVILLCKAPPWKLGTEVVVDITFNGVDYERCTRTLVIQQMPVITNIHPQSFNITQKSELLIEGINFVDANKITVQFYSLLERKQNMIPAFSMDNKIVCTVPPFNSWLTNEVKASEKKVEFEIQISVNVNGDDRWIVSPVSVFLYSQVPSISLIKPDAGCIWGGWKFSVYLSTPVSKNLSSSMKIRFSACTGGSETILKLQDKEAVLIGSTGASNKISVNMPRLEDHIKVVFIQFSFNGVEFSEFDKSHRIYLWKDWHNRSMKKETVGSLSAFKKHQLKLIASSRNIAGSDLIHSAPPATARTECREVQNSSELPSILKVAKNNNRMVSNLQTKLSHNSEQIHADLQTVKIDSDSNDGSNTDLVDYLNKVLMDTSTREATRESFQYMLDTVWLKKMIDLPEKSLTFEDLSSFIRHAFRPNVTDDELIKLWRIVDCNNKGFVTVDNFFRRLSNKQQPIPEIVDRDPAFPAKRILGVPFGNLRESKLLSTNGIYSKLLDEEAMSRPVAYDFDDKLLGSRSPSVSFGEKKVHGKKKENSHWHGRHWANAAVHRDSLGPGYYSSNHSLIEAKIPIPKFQEKSGRRRSVFKAILEEIRRKKPNNLESKQQDNEQTEEISSPRRPHRPSSIFCSNTPRFQREFPRKTWR